MGGVNAFDSIDVQLVINGHIYQPSDIGLFRLLVVFEEDGDSGVELHCVDNEYRIADSVDFQPGQVLSLRWGYRMSKVYSKTYSGFVIQKPSTDYGEDGVVSVVKAYTKSGILAASRPQKVYNNKKLGDVVKDVASRANMEVVWSTPGAGQEIVSALSQATRSDRELLRMLSDWYGYQVSYVGNQIIFDKITYSETPSKLLKYSKGEDSVIRSANVSNDAKKDAGGVAGASFDPVQKVKKIADDKKAEEALQLAISGLTGEQAVVPIRDAGATPVNEPPLGAQSEAQKMLAGAVTGILGNQDLGADLSGNSIRTIMSQPDLMGTISESEAAALKFNTSKKKCGLELECVGLPDLEIRQLVQVEGLAKRDNGNWYVSKTLHEIDQGSGYSTRVECNRSHTNVGSGLGTDSKKVNTKKASDDPAAKVEPQMGVAAVNGNRWKQ